MSEMPSDIRVPVWTLGDRLEKAREDAKISVQEMADFFGVSRNTIGNYEADRTHPNVGTVRLWSLRCGVPLEWLRDGTADTPAATDGGVITSSFSPPFVGVSRQVA